MEDTKQIKKLKSIDERHASFDGLEEANEQYDGLSEQEERRLKWIAIKLVDGTALTQDDELFITDKAAHIPAFIHDHHHHSHRFLGQDLSKYDEKQLRRKLKAKILFGGTLDSDEEDFAFRRDLL